METDIQMEENLKLDPYITYPEIFVRLTESKKTKLKLLGRKRMREIKRKTDDLEFVYIKIKNNKRQHKQSKKASHTLEVHITNKGIVFRT